jgi:hypothetical protein
MPENENIVIIPENLVGKEDTMSYRMWADTNKNPDTKFMSQQEYDELNKEPEQKNNPETKDDVPETKGDNPEVKDKEVIETTPKTIDWKKFGDEFDDEEKVVTTFKTQKEKVAEYEKRVNEQTELIKQLQNKQPEFADPRIAQYNELFKKGLKDMDTINKIMDIDNIKDPMKVLILNDIFKHPEKKGNEEDLEYKYTLQYDLELPDDYDELDEDQQAKIDKRIKAKREIMADAAEAVRAELKQAITVDVPQPKTQEQIQEEYNVNVAKFTPKVEGMFEEGLKFNSNLDIQGEKMNIEYSLELDNKDLLGFKNYLIDNLSKGVISPPQFNVLVSAYVGENLAKNLEKRDKKIAESVQKKLIEQIRKQKGFEKFNIDNNIVIPDSGEPAKDYRKESSKEANSYFENKMKVKN